MLRFLFLLFLFPFFAYSSISIEPYIGGGIAYFDDLHSGFSIGSRLGYSNWGLMSGIDVNYAQFHSFDIGQKVKRQICDSNQGKRGVSQLVSPPCDEGTEQTAESLYNIISIGPSVSFELPLIIDAYASVIWSWVDKKMLSVQKSFSLSGPGAKLGISYLSLPFLQVNLEVQALILSCSSLDDECQEQNNIANPILMGQVYISVPINTGLL